MGSDHSVSGVHTYPYARPTAEDWAKALELISVDADPGRTPRARSRSASRWAPPGPVIPEALRPAAEEDRGGRPRPGLVSAPQAPRVRPAGRRTSARTPSPPLMSARVARQRGGSHTIASRVREAWWRRVGRAARGARSAAPARPAHGTAPAPSRPASRPRRRSGPRHGAAASGTPAADRHPLPAGGPAARTERRRGGGGSSVGGPARFAASNSSSVYDVPARPGTALPYRNPMIPT
jgi:hypothetical protein